MTSIVTHEPRGARAWLRRGPDLLLLAAIVVFLIPLWLFPHFPSQDGPNHLYSANILLRYGTPEGGLYRQFYEISARPDPNWLSHALLAGLLAPAPPAVAEKLLLTLYLILLPLGFRYALRSLRPGAEAMTPLVFPLVYNWMFHIGFYNYVLSLAVMLFALGYWMRHEANPRPRHAAGLAALLLGLFFFHLVSLVMALAACGVLTVWLGFYERDARRLGRRLAFTVAAALPAAALAIYFLVRMRRLDPSGAPLRLFFEPAKLVSLFTLDTTLFTFRRAELAFGKLLAVTLLGAALVTAGLRLRARRLERWDGLALVTLAWLAIYLAAPAATSGGMYLYHRLAIYVPLGVALWLGAAEPPRLLRLAACGLAGGLALILLLFYARCYQALQEPIAEYLSAEAAVAPGTVIAGICLDPWGTLPGGTPLAVTDQPFRHLSSLVALRRGCVNLSEYEGSTAYFPTRFRAGLDPEPIAGPHWTIPEQMRVDLERYETVTGRKIDAVLVWDDHGFWTASPLAARLRAWVEANYRLALVSQPHGWMKVYRKKNKP